MSDLKAYMDYSPEVAAALAEHRPIVALESLIIANPNRPQYSIDRAKRYNEILKSKGVTPATIAILKGRIKIGLSDEEVSYLAHNGASKTTRRDVPAALAMGLDGATTVTSTMMFADLANIRVFATGGIGGVHRGAQETFDISTDLQELSRTSVCVVGSGCKSILDQALTLEVLETMGVPVLGYHTDVFPSFFCIESPYKVDYRIDDDEVIGKMLQAKKAIGQKGGILLCNPCPKQYALNYNEMEKEINAACKAASSQGIHGKALTPFLLDWIENKTEGKSQKANYELIIHNVEVAADIAIAAAKYIY
ncbi:MAG: pseudouridine-5'-phosphate glycosidase [Erysipelotrichaceae bacterium]|jgi:pseudouridine-5'-phosphate glycosidase|nr:pseudouridine-5'-phosphate glycosidase [Erysipelotrichaceae bacterium]